MSRKHGLSTEPVPVSAYAGSSKNPKDLKVRYPCTGVPRTGVPRSQGVAPPSWDHHRAIGDIDEDRVGVRSLNRFEDLLGPGFTSRVHIPSLWVLLSHSLGGGAYMATVLVVMKVALP